LLVRQVVSRRPARRSVVFKLDIGEACLRVLLPAIQGKLPRRDAWKRSRFERDQREIMGVVNSSAVTLHRLANGLGHGDFPVRRGTTAPGDPGVFISADGAGIAGGRKKTKKVRAARVVGRLLNMADDADAIVEEIFHRVEE